MNGQEFVNRIKNIKTRFSQKPEETQRKIIRKANRVVNAEFRDVKDFWNDIKAYLRQ